MSTAPEGVDLDELTVVARTVLLDGLDAIREHRDSVTVVGAQAVHLRTHHVGISAASHTSDGDLGLDPCTLEDEPLLERSLRDAGFYLKNPSQPGLWLKDENIGGRRVPVELDLLVGEQFAGRGSRSAEIRPHDKMSARRVPGLETAVVDRSPATITALDGSGRSAVVHVAGPVSLFVAKCHKIRDRLDDGVRGKHIRLTAKDAGDVYRLMVGFPPEQLVEQWSALLAEPRVGTVTTTGLRLLREQFGGARTAGVDLAVEALAGAVPERRVRLLAPRYVEVFAEIPCT